MTQRTQNQIKLRDTTDIMALCTSISDGIIVTGLISVGADTENAKT
jgi:hypothetical protein